MYTPASDALPVAPSLLRRFAERFALIAFGLYHLPLFINNYPSLGGGGFNETGLAPRWGHLFTPPAVWVARNVLHVARITQNSYQGDNGDVSEEYARLLLAVAIGVIGALAWAFADRRRPKGKWVESTLRVLLRYSIVLGIMSYAIAKLLPQQFPPVPITTLETRVGDLSPMMLLWTFMEYSRAYAFFGGVMEFLAVALLCFRRTATLGALLAVAVMTNVALLNYAYGVPVKLYATMITISAAVLVLYDARRLFDFFVRGRAVAIDRSSTWLQDSMSPAWRNTIKTVGVGSVMLSSIVAMAPTLHRPADSPLDGAWVVTASNAATPWRRMVVSPFGVVLTTSDSLVGCGRTPGRGTASVLSLRCRGGRTAELKWARVQDTLQLDGTFAGAPLHVTATHVGRGSYNLMKSQFKWIVE